MTTRAGERAASVARARAHGLAVLAVAAATGVAALAQSEIDVADVAMIYLVAIAGVAARLGRGPSILAAALSVAAFDFFFVPPYFTFEVRDLRHLITFAVLFVAGLVIATLTERLRASTAEAESAKLRAETEELRSSLLSSVSHDLRTPLAAITGAASTLADEGARLSAAERGELVETIGEEAARLERLVANLLDMSRLESGAKLRKEWIPLEEIVGSALRRLDRRLSGRPVRARLPEGPGLVEVDPVLFEQALVNLLENAAKHTPPGTPIDLDARRVEGAIVLEIADRGPGIATGDEHRIFEKFERGGTSAPGAGLGLAICRAIVHAHGGSIAVRGRDGGGAVFSVRLPGAERTVELPREEALAPEPSR
jgi:two-component system sensor histidine kinase KdpD